MSKMKNKKNTGKNEQFDSKLHEHKTDVFLFYLWEMRMVQWRET